MKYYPVNLDIRNRKCLVVGGGSVGARKVATLLTCGATVTVISPGFTQQLLKLAEKGLIKLKKRSYQTLDLDNVFLVVGATNNEELNMQISHDAQRLNILCNIVDRPQACSFILPSIVNRGDLIIAISTSGKSPAFAKKLRIDLENEFGEEYDVFLRLMGAIRKKVLSPGGNPDAHKHQFKKLISKGLPKMIKNRETNKINALLFEVFGKGYEFKSLIKTGCFQ